MDISKTKEILKNIIIKLPFSFFLKSQNANLTIPYYHMVSNEEIPHIKHIYPHKTVQQFSNDVDCILKHFKPIDLMTLLAFIKKGREIPQESLLLTFDDGFAQMHDVVMPILLKKGISATFFINSDFTDNINLCHQHKASIIVKYLLLNNISDAAKRNIEQLLPHNGSMDNPIIFHILSIKYDQRDLIDRIAEILEIDFKRYLKKHQPYLTTQQIQKMVSVGFTIGAHSIDHPLYADISLEEQLRQTIESVTFVRNRFNLDYGAFAFPHSDNGVSEQYFHQIEESGLVDVSFGTAGMIADSVPNHFQRFSLEKPLLPAKNIFTYQYAKRLWRNIKHSNKRKRN